MKRPSTVTSAWKKARGVKNEIRDLQTILYVNSRCMNDEDHCKRIPKITREDPILRWGESLGSGNGGKIYKR